MLRESGGFPSAEGVGFVPGAGIYLVILVTKSQEAVDGAGRLLTELQSRSRSDDYKYTFQTGVPA